MGVVMVEVVVERIVPETGELMVVMVLRESWSRCLKVMVFDGHGVCVMVEVVMVEAVDVVMEMGEVMGWMW